MSRHIREGCAGIPCRSDEGNSARPPALCPGKSNLPTVRKYFFSSQRDCFIGSHTRLV
jgi:hypothetical protein